MLGAPIKKAGPQRAVLYSNQKSLGQPGLNGGGAVFCFPFLQRFVIAAFGFDDFAGVRTLAALYRPNPG